MIKIVYAVLIAAAAFGLGILACILIHRQKAKRDQRQIESAEQEALRIVNEAIKNAEMSMETAEERGYTFSELGRMFKKLGIEPQNK